VHPDPSHSPRVLLLPGTADCGNLGDLAMLQIALERLRGLWPAAILRVLTNDAAALAAGCPGVEPVPLRGRNRWLKIRALPRWLFPNVRPARRSFFPLSIRQAWKLGMFLSPAQYRITRQFVEAMFNADLFVLAGCGVVTDVFAYNAIRILDTFDFAHRCGIPTAMLSQGIGPMADPALEKRAGEVLPQVGRIFLRESRTTLPLLQRLRVPQAHIAVTGDDAVELAYRERRPDLGTGIGVNLRLARYSSLDQAVLGVVRQVLVGQADRHQARLLGFPIALSGAESDRQTLAHLFQDLKGRGEAGNSLRTPVEVIRRLSECRVVVTGSYHGAVFALSQGVPALCVAESVYYLDKFRGLADQFTPGCLVLRAGQPDLTQRLAAAFDDLWSQAGALRAPLLEAAEQQIKAARAAYAGLPSLVSPDDPRPSPA
jgi:polysaccharide pyruvyl transferase WcaK-like protein